MHQFVMSFHVCRFWVESLVSVYTRSFYLCQFVLGHVTYVSLYSVVLHMSVYTRLFYVCHFILSHVTDVSLYSVMWHMTVYTQSCDMSVYTVMRHTSVHTQSCDICQFILLCDICQFILSYVTYVSLYSVMRHMSVSYSFAVRNSSRSGGCFPVPFYTNVYNHEVGFVSCDLWSDEYLKCHGFPFLPFLPYPWPKTHKRNASETQRRQLECYKYSIYPFHYCLTCLRR